MNVTQPLRTGRKTRASFILGMLVAVLGFPAVLHAQNVIEDVAVAKGARRNTILSAPAGISGSFKTNFSKSAND